MFSRSIATLLLLASLASGDAVILKSGERFIGDVSEEGDSLRVRNDRFPDGVLVKKADVKVRYPAPDAMLGELAAKVRKAKDRYDEGKRAADPNPAMKDVLDQLFDPELEAADAAEIYPSHKEAFNDILKGIHELRKLARDGQKLEGPKVDPKPVPKPDPKPDPVPDPKPDPRPKLPEPEPGDFTDRAAVFLAGPEGASASDLEKAAKAMATRCASYGYKGVTGKVEPGARPLVRLEVDGGFSATMVQTISILGRYAAKSFEMRLYYGMTAGEKEQFPIPRADEVAGAKAPPGAKWCARVRFNADGPDAPREPSIMRLAPVINRGEIMPPYRDKPDYNQWYYVVSNAAEARLVPVARSGATIRSEIVVDDVLLVTDITPTPQEHPKDGRVWWRHTFSEKERKVIDAYRGAGMPVGLRVVEGPK